MKKQNNRLEIYIGQRLRQRRLILGMAATELAELIGISTLELASYEEGRRRIPPLQLATIAAQLQVSISYFFETGAPADEGGEFTGTEPWFSAFLRRELRTADPLHRAWLEDLLRRAEASRPAEPEPDAEMSSDSEQR